MHLMPNAHERTRNQWNNLFQDTHWHVQSRIPFAGHVIVLLEKDKNKNPPLLSTLPCSTTIVRRVVLPMAGLGTRMRPQSFIQTKVLLPIVRQVSNMWACRPALKLLLADIFAYGTDIEQILCIISPEH
jgi:hypothetical protein